MQVKSSTTFTRNACIGYTMGYMCIEYAMCNEYVSCNDCPFLNDNEDGNEDSLDSDIPLPPRWAGGKETITSSDNFP
jgi:hypothetical protein